MESYRTEEEQVKALKRWWDENGRSTVVAIVFALSAGFGWQGWQNYSEGQREVASDLYQAMLQAVTAVRQGTADDSTAITLGNQLKQEFAGST